MVVSNNESVDQLSHQICNHLARIMLASNLLQFELEEILSAEQRYQFKGIDEAARQIRTLLARLNHAAEAELGLLRPEPGAKA